MNGFFIIAEISGLQQFLNVEPAASGEMIKNCERSINNSFRSELHISGSMLVFFIESEIDGAAEVIEASVSLLELISGYSEEIHEFSMLLIHRLNPDMESEDTELRQRFFSISVDNCLLVENRVMRAAGMPADDETYGMYQLISIEDSLQEKDGLNQLGILIRPKEVERLLRMIVPEIGDNEEKKSIILRSGSELLARLHIEEAVKQACGKNKTTAAINIDILDDETDVVRPFARSVDKQLLSVVQDNLKGVELRTWTDGKYKLDSINSDSPPEYFFSIYCLYLKGIMTSFRDALQPAVIIFSGLGKDKSEYIRYAERLLGYLPEECRPTAFFIETGEAGSINLGEYDYFSDAERISCCEDIQEPDSGVKLSFHDRRLLYVLKTVEGLFERSQLDEFLLKLDYSHPEIQSGIKSLTAAGLINEGRYVRLLRSPYMDSIFDGISDKEKIAKVLACYLTERVLSGDFSDYGRAAKALSSFVEIPEAAQAVFQCLTIMLDYGRTAWVLNFLSGCEKLDQDISDAVELRCFLIENDKAACLRVLKGRPESPESPDSLQNAMFLLSTACYHHAANDIQRSMDYVKKVLIYLQESDYPRLEGIAFTELGFLMLCKGKLLESSEYLSLAVEKLTGSNDNYSLMRVFLFSAIQKYLWGSIDEALSECEKALTLVGKSGFSEWYFFIEFFRCRIFFEIGRYYDAEKVLAACLLQNELYRNEDRKKIFSAWTARACIYQGKIYRGINMLLSLREDPEVLFFLAEAYYFNGNMDKAVESIEKAGVIDSYFNIGFIPLDFISWKNGFTSVEGRVLQSEKGTGVLLHNIRALHAFLLGLTGNREYGTEILFKLTRDEKISEIDPFNRQYFYFYCQLLDRRQNTEMIDKLTLISKALKYLQQISSRINNPRIRQEFMTKNYWNSLLVNEAQREKLI